MRHAALLILTFALVLPASVGCRPRRVATRPPTLDYASPPAFGGVALRYGFLPDPQGLSGIAGGPYDADGLGPGCRGWLEEAPGHVVRLQTPFEYLRIFVHSPADTVLVVRAPDGRVHCDDDTGPGVDPLLEDDYWNPGDYVVWVGTRRRDTAAPYQLFLSTIGR